MKKLIVLFPVIFLFGIFHSLGQPTWQFNKTTWIIDNHWGPGPDDFIRGSLNTGFTNSDTVINLINYKKITLDTAGLNFFAAIRSDNHRVYESIDFDSDGTNEEYLVYDFNANVGDTLFNVFLDQEHIITDFVIVDKDSFLLNNKYYIVQKIAKTSSPSDYLIWENIGTVHGLFLFTGLIDDYLSCYSNNDSVLDLNTRPYNLHMQDTVESSFGNCNYMLTGIGKKNTESFNIYPNPNSGNFFISLNSGIQGIKSIKMLNTLGIIVYFKNNITEEINLSELPKGIYFLNIETDNGLAENKKIIIQ